MKLPPAPVLDLNTRLTFLEHLRALAAISVALFHFNKTYPQQENLYRAIVEHGHLGVPIFFIISGLVNIWSLQKSPHPLQFLVKRVFRIFPAYYASVLFLLALALIHKHFLGVNDITTIPRSFAHIVSVLTITTGVLTGFTEINNWVYWSLTYELTFYLIFSLIFITPKYSKLLIHGVTVWGALFYLCNFNQPFFLKWWNHFALGIGVFYLTTNAISSGVFLLGINFLIIYLVYSPALSILSSITVLAILYAIRSPKSLLNTNNFMAQIGEASYSVYLFHIPIGCHILARHRAEDAPAGVSTAYDIMMLAVVLLFSLLFYRYYERFFITVGRKAACVFKN